MLESLETRRVLAAFQVTSILDTVNASDGVVTLREAINSANSMPGADTITFATSTNDNAIALSVSLGQLQITDSLATRFSTNNSKGLEADYSMPSELLSQRHMLSPRSITSTTL